MNARRACGFEVHRRAGRDETAWLHLAVVDGLDYGRVREDRTEWLHHIERERGSAKTRTVVEAEIGIEADRGEHCEPSAREHRIGEREHFVKWVGGRAARALVEGEFREVARSRAEHRGEQPEVARRRLAFETEQLRLARRMRGSIG
jgi:hypothetical protein